MFSSFPNLFGRDFLIGYFLPAVVLTGGGVYLLVERGAISSADLREHVVDDTVVVFALLSVVAWLIAACFLAFNGGILRFMEGYVGAVLLDPLAERRRRRFRETRQYVARCDEALADDRAVLADLDRAIAGVQEEMLECDDAIGGGGDRDDPGRELQAQRDDAADRLTDLEGERNRLAEEIAALQADRDKRADELAINWPGDEAWVLPFKFGNVVRAFETYPMRAYGLEAMVGWPRLLVVMPEHYRALIDGAKAQVDFLLNLWATWWAMLLFHAALVVSWWDRPWTFTWDPWWFPLAALAAIWSLTKLARGAAVQWGELVKAGFDMYLSDLREQLDVPRLTSPEAERAFWEELSLSWLEAPAGVNAALHRGRRPRERDAPTHEPPEDDDEGEAPLSLLG